MKGFSMAVEQSIRTPFGINVFGSSTVRIAPDLATLSFSVVELKPTPKEAFQAARETTLRVQEFLVKAQIKDAGSSHINLHTRFEYLEGRNQFVGYQAEVGFRVLLYDLTRTEEILTGIVDAGVGQIASVEFQTTRLKELRLEARRKAVTAAREKADAYCKAAGIELGEVIHIEDVNPDQLRRNQGHVQFEVEIEDDGQTQAFDPESIVVSGAVMIAYKIQNSEM
jgi:uncharacterized protein